MTVFARVVFPLPLAPSFLYAVPEAFRSAARPGSRVIAPLGTRRQNGFIVALTTDPPPAGIRGQGTHPGPRRPALPGRALPRVHRPVERRIPLLLGEILETALPPSLAEKTKVTVVLTSAGQRALDNAQDRARKPGSWPRCWRLRRKAGAHSS